MKADMKDDMRAPTFQRQVEKYADSCAYPSNQILAAEFYSNPWILLHLNGDVLLTLFEENSLGLRESLREWISDSPLELLSLKNETLFI